MPGNSQDAFSKSEQARCSACELDLGTRLSPLIKLGIELAIELQERYQVSNLHMLNGRLAYLVQVCVHSVDERELSSRSIFDEGLEDDLETASEMMSEMLFIRSLWILQALYQSKCNKYRFPSLTER